MLSLALAGGSVSLGAAIFGLIAGASVAYGMPEVRAAVLARRGETDPRALGGAIIAGIAFVVLVIRPATPPAAAIAGIGVGIAAFVVFSPPPSRG